MYKYHKQQKNPLLEVGGFIVKIFTLCGFNTTT